MNHRAPKIDTETYVHVNTRGEVTKVVRKFHSLRSRIAWWAHGATEYVKNHSAGLLIASLALAFPEHWILLVVGSIAFDSVTATQPSMSSGSVSHTTTSSTPRAMVIGFSYTDSRDAFNTTPIKYNGTGLSNQMSYTGGSNVKVRFYTLVTPDSGTHNVTWASTFNAPCVIGIMTLTGVDTSTLVGATNTSQPGNGNPVTLSLTTSYNNSLVISCIALNNAGSFTLTNGALGTERWNLTSGNHKGGGNSRDTTAAGSYSLDWVTTDTSGTAWGIIEIASADQTLPPTPHTIEKAASYRLNVAATTKSARYAVKTSPTITKSGAYQPPANIYSRQALAALPGGDTNLATFYTAAERTDVASDNATYVAVSGGGKLLHLFKLRHTNSTDKFTLTWNGKASIAPSAAGVHLQLYNRTSGLWETLASNTGAAADTDFTLTGYLTTGFSDYYDANHVLSVRVYQALT